MPTNVRENRQSDSRQACTLRRTVYDPQPAVPDGTPLIDKDASTRLRKEVQRLYLERTDRATFSVLALSEWSGVNRAPLRNYLVNGVFPDPDVLAKLADKLGVPVAHLWVRWLDLGASDPLTRIADALDRAYPLPDPTEEAEAEARLARAASGAATSEAPRAPRGSAGSAG